MYHENRDFKKLLLLQIDAIRRKNTNALNFIPYSSIQKSYIEKGRYIVICKDEQVIGYLLHGSIKEDKPLVLTHIASKDKYHVGLQLFKQLVEKAKEYNCSCIRVRCAATLNIKWDHLGFKLVETLKVNNTRKRDINIWIYPLD